MLKGPYRTVLFDFDGTVFDTIEGITRSVQYSIRKHGLDAELDELRCFAGPPLLDKYMEVFGVAQQEAEQMVVDFRERYVPVGIYESAPFPGIRELLNTLQDAGMTLGIATSKPQSMAELLLERADLFGFFTVIAGSRPQLNNERKWQVVRRVMSLCDAEEESTVLIGDTKYDVEGAHQAGIPCIGVRWGYAAKGELEEAGADGIAEGMEDLRRLLTGENG